ncbi:MAG: hypothetical protein HIU83_10675 [Proteobacteria bacterium]|nr:hypothetical protein [Pseudomonadota bacterium]
MVLFTASDKSKYSLLLLNSIGLSGLPVKGVLMGELLLEKALLGFKNGTKETANKAITLKKFIRKKATLFSPFRNK